MKVKTAFALFFILTFQLSTATSKEQGPLHIYLLGGVAEFSPRQNQKIREGLLGIYRVFEQVGGIDPFRIQVLFQRYFTTHNLKKAIAENGAGTHLFYFYGDFKLEKIGPITAYQVENAPQRPPEQKKQPRDKKKKKITLGKKEWMRLQALKEAGRIRSDFSWLQFIQQMPALKFTTNIEALAYEENTQYVFMPAIVEEALEFKKPRRVKIKADEAKAYVRFIDRQGQVPLEINRWLKDHLREDTTYYFFLHPYRKTSQLERSVVVKNGALIPAEVSLASFSSQLARFYTNQIGQQKRDLPGEKTLEDLVMFCFVSHYAEMAVNLQNILLKQYQWVSRSIQSNVSFETRYTYHPNENEQIEETVNFITYRYSKSRQVRREIAGVEKVISFKEIPGQWR